MINITRISGESKTGDKAYGNAHWYATTDGFDGVGDTPIDAVMELAESMYRYILRSEP